MSLPSHVLRRARSVTALMDDYSTRTQSRLLVLQVVQDLVHQPQGQSTLSVSSYLVLLGRFAYT